MTQTESVTGAEYLARSLAANGTSHVFFIDAVLRRTLIELGTLGVQRVLGHSEKAVAYMADGYLGRAPVIRHDRPQTAVDAAPQCVSGNPAPADVLVGNKILGQGRCGVRPSAADAPGLAGVHDRHAPSGAPGPERIAGGDDRDRDGQRSPDR